MLDSVKYLIGAPGASGFGSKSTAEEVTQTSDLRSITAIITGATSGIGAETARVLAMRGARLILPARSVKAAEEVKARIVSEFPCSQIIIIGLDLSSLGSVRNFVREFESLDLPLDLLINNAGKFSYEYGVTEDGVETTFATNYLGHFLLTKLLLNKMVETAKESGVQGRIVNVSSSVHGWFSGDMMKYLGQINGSKSQYDPTRAYALSKLANVLHTKELALTLKKMKANITVNCVHPGIVRTRLTRDREGLLTDFVFFMASKLLKTIPQYFADSNEALTSKIGCNSDEASRLWFTSEYIVSNRGSSKVVFDPIDATLD